VFPYACLKFAGIRGSCVVDAVARTRQRKESRLMSKFSSHRRLWAIVAALMLALLGPAAVGHVFAGSSDSDEDFETFQECFGTDQGSDAAN
jgi:hypothetical protein